MLEDAAGSDSFSTCFGCGEDNPGGLQLKRDMRIEGEEAIVETSVPSRFEGFRGVVHGGIVATLLDETMGLACTQGLGLSGAMTAEISVRFRAPVLVDSPVTVRARAVRDGRKLNCTAEVVSPEGLVLAEGAALWILPADSNQMVLKESPPAPAQLSLLPDPPVWEADPPAPPASLPSGRLARRRRRASITPGQTSLF
jgi:uncharacterized protein (TIGR00369 family)